MDLAFEILLPNEAEIPFRFEIPTFEWGGVKYPQGRPEYIYNPHYKLIKTSVAPHVVSNLPIIYQEANWICIGVYGDGLDNYRTSLLESGPEYNDESLNKLLYNLLTVATKWVVVFEPFYDATWEINSGTIESVIEVIKRAVAFERKGFIIYGEN